MSSTYSSIEDYVIALEEQGFDTFWKGLTSEEKRLTRLFCHEEELDAIVIIDGDVWIVWTDGKEYSSYPLGQEKELVIYASLETTGLENEDQLDFFIEELAIRLKPMEVIKGESPQGTAGVEWVTTATWVDEAWKDCIYEASQTYY
jgi:hypothetical protein